MLVVRLLFFVIVITKLGISANAALAAEPAPLQPETVATIPSPAFNENIAQDVDGTIYVSSMLESTVWKISPDGKVAKFSDVDQYAAVLGVAAVSEGIVVGAFRRDFRTPQGYDFSDAGPAVLLLDRNTGKVLAEAPGQNGQLFNGMTADGRGGVLVVDSLSASVWQFNPKARTLKLWLKDVALESSTPAARGANGIKVAGDHVYIAMSEKRSIFRVGIDSDGKPQGMISLFAKDLPYVDDFAVRADGVIYLPPSSQANPGPMFRVPVGGTASPYAVGPSGASALVSRDGKWVYWASNSGMVPKLADPQKLLRVPAR